MKVVAQLEHAITFYTHLHTHSQCNSMKGIACVTRSMCVIRNIVYQSVHHSIQNFSVYIICIHIHVCRYVYIYSCLCVCSSISCTHFLTPYIYTPHAYALLLFTSCEILGLSCLFASLTPSMLLSFHVCNELQLPQWFYCKVAFYLTIFSLLLYLLYYFPPALSTFFIFSLLGNILFLCVEILGLI